MDNPVHYALLRDGLHWDGECRGLAIAPDGALALVRVPAPTEGNKISVDEPFDAEPSGIAARCDEIVVADTNADCIVFERPSCGFRYSTSHSTPQLSAPAGLAIHGDDLYVADSNNARVAIFRLPAMELRRQISLGLSQPTAVAVDHDGRVYVLDRGINRILRFSSAGALDPSYTPSVTQPLYFSLTADALLYVSDATSNTVLAFDATGASALPLAFSAQLSVRPQALAADGNAIFVADATSGSILVCDAKSRLHIGSVPYFRAPVSAMAFDSNGDLLVKTDGTDVYTRLVANSGCIASGTLTIGPLDAGELSDWERTVVSAESPDGVVLETFTQPTTVSAPQENQWLKSPSIDCLLNREAGPADSTTASRRYLWLRLTVQSADGRISPTLTQVQAQTTGVSYLDMLPRMFRRDDQAQRFLERWLALFRSGFEARDGEVDFLFREFDPATAPPEKLHQLAKALAFDPPADLSATQRRKLLARVPELYAQRGTIAGLQALAEIYSGFRPKIIEAHRARRVWELGETSLLGFDTALAAATPEGFVVPHDALADASYVGLYGQYYRGTEFDELIRSKTDETIAFAGLNLRTDTGHHLAPFTVRWSGQLRPRFSETHLIGLKHLDGARLWIDGRLLIDSFKGTDPGVFQVRMPLDATRWHSIQLEIRSYSPRTHVTLSWSSRQQRLETIPRDCFYSLLDELADLSATQAAFDVGNAVVGESAPQDVSEFGSTISSDYAHLFTVIAPAGCCSKAEERRALRALIDAEKPAHTDYHLCFVEPRMRVGFQARLGIDAIVATPPPSGRLDGALLNSTSYLADALPGGSRVGARARLGFNTVTG